MIGGNGGRPEVKVLSLGEKKWCERDEPEDYAGKTRSVPAHLQREPVLGKIGKHVSGGKQGDGSQRPYSDCMGEKEGPGHFKVVWRKKVDTAESLSGGWDHPRKRKKERSFCRKRISLCARRRKEIQKTGGT